MSLDTFNKGGSVPRTVTLTDGTSALDTSIFTTIEVKIFNKLHRGISTYTLATGTVTKIMLYLLIALNYKGVFGNSQG